jgi:hypothetical protein
MRLPFARLAAGVTPALVRVVPAMLSNGVLSNGVPPTP